MVELYDHSPIRLHGSLLSYRVGCDAGMITIGPRRSVKGTTEQRLNMTRATAGLKHERQSARNSKVPGDCIFISDNFYMFAVKT
jgi:hypothetical protein